MAGHRGQINCLATLRSNNIIGSTVQNTKEHLLAGASDCKIRMFDVGQQAMLREFSDKSGVTDLKSYSNSTFLSLNGP